MIKWPKQESGIVVQCVINVQIPISDQSNPKTTADPASTVGLAPTHLRTSSTSTTTLQP